MESRSNTRKKREREPQFDYTRRLESETTVCAPRMVTKQRVRKTSDAELDGISKIDEKGESERARVKRKGGVEGISSEGSSPCPGSGSRRSGADVLGARAGASRTAAARAARWRRSRATRWGTAAARAPPATDRRATAAPTAARAATPRTSAVAATVPRRTRSEEEEL